MRKPYQICLPILLVCLIPAVANAQAPATPPVYQGGGSFVFNAQPPHSFIPAVPVVLAMCQLTLHRTAPKLRIPVRLPGL